jgi:predicted O-methyltransferase YrrM
MEMLEILQSHLKDFGFQETVERSTVWAITRLFPSAFHKRDRPALGTFFESGASIHLAPMDLLEEYPSRVDRNIDRNQLWWEYQQFRAELDLRYKEKTQRHPPRSAVEDGAAFVLYSLVRINLPAVAVETGVANGHSSFFILKAMIKNGFGRLHSIDIFDGVGTLLTGEERALWHLHVLDSENLKQSFTTLIDSLPTIDFFLQDSDHTYRWQYHELKTVWGKLGEAGIIAADDTDSSHAFLDFCQNYQAIPTYLIDRRKVFGLLVKACLPTRGWKYWSRVGEHAPFAHQRSL